MAARKKPGGGKGQDKIWSDAVRRAVHRLQLDGKKTKRLDMLADKLVSEGINGNISALKEIGDRLDGKASQAMELGGVDGEPLIIELVRFGADTSAEDETPNGA